jgi:uncharacterized repeat protein (TIGR03803 family)
MSRLTRCILTLLCAATAIAAQNFTTLVNFRYGNGANPLAPLVQGADGNFYGTTTFGGVTTNGTIFRITPGGVLTTLYTFCVQSDCSDGREPGGALVLALDGSFYGTTMYGGADRYGYGTIFKVSLAGELTTLHAFQSTDGAYPNGGLIQAFGGDLYGTTFYGGGNGQNVGTIFKGTSATTIVTLHSFCNQTGCRDGEYPRDRVVQGADGRLYGTTVNGASNMDGEVFQITPQGKLTILYAFCSQPGCADGSNPYAGLVQASDGNFYGTTLGGGGGSSGTIFRITPAGVLTTLHNFAPRSRGGSVPTGDLIQATDGNLYGLTAAGGANNGGTIFRMTLDGALTPIYNFPTANMAYGNAGLVQGTDGSFYGTTYGAGAYGFGSVFRLTMGLGPFVRALPVAGSVGDAVQILGSNLTGATRVSFNGAAAAFTVVSASLITATVPAGATSGDVQVTTPSATLLSNAPFLVR